MIVNTLLSAILNGHNIDDVVSEALTAAQRTSLAKRAKALKWSRMHKRQPHTVRIRSRGARGMATTGIRGKINSKIQNYISGHAKKAAHSVADDETLKKKISGFFQDEARKAKEAVEADLRNKARTATYDLRKLVTIPTLAGAAIGGTIGYKRRIELAQELEGPARSKKAKALRKRQAWRGAAGGAAAGGAIGGLAGAWEMRRRYLRRR